MAYTSGMLRERVAFLRPFHRGSAEGAVSGWVRGAEAWAAVDWSRGTRALREGEVSVYDVIMVRLRWRPDVSKYCRLMWDGRFFIIESFNADRRGNTIQITAVETGAFEIMDIGAWRP